MAKDTEKAILIAAQQHFVQKGYVATRMEDIAAAADINKAMLHYYFRTKEKLFEEIVNQTLNTLIPRIAQAMDSEGTVLEKLEKVVDTYVSTLIEYPSIPFFIMSELSQKREHFVGELKKRAHLLPAVPAFIAQMQQEMAVGKIRTFDPLHLFLSVVGMCVFPFMAKPLFCNVMDIPEAGFDYLMQARAAEVKRFLQAALSLE